MKTLIVLVTHFCTHLSYSASFCEDYASGAVDSYLNDAGCDEGYIGNSDNNDPTGERCSEENQQGVYEHSFNRCLAFAIGSVTIGL